MLKLLLLILLSTPDLYTYQKKRVNLATEMVSQIAPEQISFAPLNKENELLPSNISTASALHFARIYLDQQGVDFLESARLAITSVKKHRFLPAIQAAMETARPSHPFIESDSIAFTHQKMEAYLAFEYLQIEESFGPFYSAYLHPTILKEWIQGLKEGVYVIQFSTPHTLILIKEPEIHFLYDTSHGCLAFFNHEDPSDYLMEAVALQLIGITTCYKVISL